MKKLFAAARQGRLEEVRQILEQHPALLHATAVSPPRRDHGLSPLMAAIRSGQLETAEYLLSLGADVNFTELGNPLDPTGQRATIWFDALHQCFWRAKSTTSAWNKEKTTQAFHFFCLLLDRGADPNQKAATGRYYGGPPVGAWVAALDEYEFAAVKIYSTATETNQRRQNQQLRTLTAHVLRALYRHGANIYDVSFAGRPDVTLALRNMMFNRPILFGYPVRQPAFWLTAAENLWLPMDEILRPYYQMDNPFYGMTVSEERQQFFNRLADQEFAILSK